MNSSMAVAVENEILHLQKDNTCCEEEIASINSDDKDDDKSNKLRWWCVVIRWGLNKWFRRDEQNNMGWCGWWISYTAVRTCRRPEGQAHTRVQENTARHGTSLCKFSVNLWCSAMLFGVMQRFFFRVRHITFSWKLEIQECAEISSAEDFQTTELTLTVLFAHVGKTWGSEGALYFRSHSV